MLHDIMNERKYSMRISKMEQFELNNWKDLNNFCKSHKQLDGMTGVSFLHKRHQTLSWKGLANSYYLKVIKRCREESIRLLF